LKDFSHHGIKVDNVTVDLKVMMDNKAKAVKGLTGGIEGLFKKNKVLLRHTLILMIAIY